MLLSSVHFLCWLDVKISLFFGFFDCCSVLIFFTPFSGWLHLVKVALPDNCHWFYFSLTLNAIKLLKISGKVWKLINAIFNSNYNFMNKMLQWCSFVINEIYAFKFFKYEANAYIFYWSSYFTFWCNCTWWSWWFIKFLTRLSRNCLKFLKIIFFINSNAFNSFNLLYHIFQNSFLKYCIAK